MWTSLVVCTENGEEAIDDGNRVLSRRESVMTDRHLFITPHHQSALLHTQGNVLLDGDGRAVLSDFGALKSLEPDASVMATEETVGTLYFMWVTDERAWDGHAGTA